MTLFPCIGKLVVQEDGGCLNHQKLQIKGNEVIDFGNGYNKLTKTEAQKLNV